MIYCGLHSVHILKDTNKLKHVQNIKAWDQFNFKFKLVQEKKLIMRSVVGTKSKFDVKSITAISFQPKYRELDFGKRYLIWSKIPFYFIIIIILVTLNVIKKDCDFESSVFVVDNDCREWVLTSRQEVRPINCIINL